MTAAKRSNQARAPQCAAFVEALREVFGEVKVLYVREGDVEMGRPINSGEAARSE